MPTQVQLNVSDPLQIGGYRLLGRLAEGGQGVVYLALSPSGDKVVVKVLHPTLLRDPDALDRLTKEVAAARQVAPFCTAQVLEARFDGSTPFIASEFVDGPSLATAVRTSGPLSGPALDRLAISTATALVAIHEAQVIHRDFKPANVVLGPDGPRVVDFGIARNMNNDTTIVTDRVFGTPAYMAPELMTGARADTAADLFGWAATMVFAATGRAPFEAPDVTSLMHKVVYDEPDLSGVPFSLAAVVRQCLTKNPLQRPTARQILMSLLSDSATDLRTSDMGETLARATRFTGQVPIPEHRPAPDRVLVPAFRGAADRQVDPFADTQVHAYTGPSQSYAATETAPLLQAPATSRTDAWREDAYLESDRDFDPREQRRRPARPIRSAFLAAAAFGLLAVGIKVLPGTNLVQAVMGKTTAVQASPQAMNPAKRPRPAKPSAAATMAAGTAQNGAANVIPAAFNGTWKGAIAQGADTFREVITLAAGTAGGTFTLNKFGCSGSLTAVQPPVADGLLHLHQQTLNDAQGRCAPQAEITLNLIDNDTLTFQWQDTLTPNNTAAGTLSLNQNGNQQNNQQGGQMGNQPGGQQGNQMGNQPGGQQGNQMGNQPAGQQGNQMGNQPNGNQQANQRFTGTQPTLPGA